MSDLGTIELLLRHLAESLEPLADELNPALLQDIGIGIPAAWAPQIDSDFTHVSSAAKTLPPATQELITAAAGGDAVTIIARSAALGIRIAQVAVTAQQLADHIKAAANTDGTLTPQQKQHFNDQLASLFMRLAELTAVRNLEKRLPQLAAILDLLGMFTSTPMPGIPGDPTAPPYIRRGLGTRERRRSLQGPEEVCQGPVWLGQCRPSTAASSSLRIRKFLLTYQLPAQIIEPGGSQPPILEVAVHRNAGQQVGHPARPRVRASAAGDYRGGSGLAARRTLVAAREVPGDLRCRRQGLIEQDDFTSAAHAARSTSPLALFWSGSAPAARCRSSACRVGRGSRSQRSPADWRSTRNSNTARNGGCLAGALDRARQAEARSSRCREATAS